MNDLINRQDAIKALMRESTCDGAYGYVDIKSAVETLTQLPSAEPKPKPGRWIPQEGLDGVEAYKCSECGVLWTFIDGDPKDNGADHCPRCGSRLEGEQDE